MRTATPSFVSVDKLGLKTSQGTVFNDLSFSAEKGQLISILGEPNSGKTAMLLCMCGRMKPTTGNCYIATYNVQKDFRHIRHMSQISLIPGLNDVQPFLKVKNITAAELSLDGKHGDRKHTDEYLKKWDFYDRINIRFDKLNVYDSCLFGIILAMAGDPELLIVDDIQTDLTQRESIKITKLLKKIATETGTTVLFACSEYRIAQYADAVVIVSQSKLEQRSLVLKNEPDAKTIPIVGYANGVKNDKNTAKTKTNSNTLRKERA